MKQVNKDLKAVKAVQKEEVAGTAFVAITINNVDRQYLEETRELFGAFYGRTLTDEECIEIINNMLKVEVALRNIK